MSLGQVLASQLGERKILETALAGVRDILGVCWCVLRLLEPESGELAIKASAGMSTELERRAWRVGGGGSLLGEAMRRGVAVDDITAG
ncbi:MAG TPA: diguanylate cyclase, partial [Clostridiales bacterium UBA8153]|nr:diguanylate cyclase [Clostridiales bacterium UBA8153]